MSTPSGGDSPLETTTRAELMAHLVGESDAEPPPEFLDMLVVCVTSDGTRMFEIKGTGMLHPPEHMADYPDLLAIEIEELP